MRDEAPNSTWLTAVFQVSNAQNSVNNVTFSCVATGWITCTGVDVSFYSFDPYEDIQVSVTYSTGASCGGTVTLSGNGSTGSDVGSYVSNGPPVVTLVVPALTPGSRAVASPPGGQSELDFRVRRRHYAEAPIPGCPGSSRF